MMCAFAVSAATAQANETFVRTQDVIYGRKFGTALTLDVFTPSATNGVGILCIVSSGYGSSHEAINADYYRALLVRGYTVFAVVHGSVPKFSSRMLRILEGGPNPPEKVPPRTTR